MQRMRTRLRPLPALAVLALAILFASGCGGSEGGDYGGEHPDYKPLAQAPPPLKGLYEQGDELLGGGTSAYEKRIEQLHGYPIVVNLWASWCVPCRAEFPTLQNLSARYGKKVAFLGINSEDSSDAAATFLEEAPLPYPSYSDPDKDIYGSLGGYGFPNTAFYDRSGELVYLHKGQYSDEAALEADMRRYALQSG
ncbi:MAG TPA: TlpA disulfide reductase family protein [Solirubrobacterales bacterium]|nr:TlpA disulfide reductase family protein [Solirubrobacterales bacterium]